MADGPIRLIIRQGINPGKLEEFKKLSCEFTAGTEAGDPGTLGYEWFISPEGTDCYLNEFYGSSQDFLDHFAKIGPKIGAMLEISPLIEAIALGDPTPEAREALSHLGAKFYAPYVGFCR